MLAGLAALGVRSQQAQYMGHFDVVSWTILACVIAVGWLSGLLTLRNGAQHLERIEV